MGRPALSTISSLAPLVLGSASPRRRELLERLGLPLLVMPADTDEAVEEGESAEAYLSRIVSAKLAAVAGRLALNAPGLLPGALLVADTVVLLGERILGKPSSLAEAESLVAALVGRTHRVATAYAISSREAPASALVSRRVETFVTMRAASASEIRAYAQSGEGLDKAGAYAIQGLGSFLVERIEGSYPNVVGLPVCEVISDLLALGFLREFPGNRELR